jgi:hypothetical protein
VQQVDAALFEPPPFQPSKLSVQYLTGAAVSSASLLRTDSSCSCTLPACRRYTLTHNDITGALQLSIGSDYNQRQVQGFYTRILRDEITAEWLFGQGGVAPPELHIYCHVSGEERWLAPPQLRNFIFRREMTLVSVSARPRCIHICTCGMAMSMLHCVAIGVSSSCGQQLLPAVHPYVWLGAKRVGRRL